MLPKLTVLFVSIVLSLVVAEIAARNIFPAPVYFAPPLHVFDPNRGPIPIPLEHGTLSITGTSYSYSNNSLGLRGSKEYGTKTKPRILLLGDSFTWGVGVNDDQTFAALLQKSLSDYEIINAGDPGIGTDYALKFYRTIGRTFAPDIVVLCFYHNDFWDNERHWFYDNNLNPVPLPDEAVHPKDQSIPRLRLAWLAQRAFGRLSGTSKPPALEPETTSKLLSALRDEIALDKAKFFLVYIPEKDLTRGSEQESVITSISKSLSITMQSLGPMLSSADYLPDRHWGTHGHEVAAQALYSSISQSRFIK